MKTRRIVLVAILWMPGLAAAAAFPPAWFEGLWSVSPTPEAGDCLSNAGVAWERSEECADSQYRRAFLAGSNAVGDPKAAPCVDPSAGSEFYFPAQKIDENTFVVKGRPFRKSGTQRVLPPKYFHRCNRR